MKSSRILAAAAAVLALASCSDKAHIKGTLEGAAQKQLIVKQLNINTYNVLDTIKTKADGSFAYDVKVAEGEPEFVYLFYGDTRVAALLLEKGETATVSADTLGNYAVSGSEGSFKLAETDKAYADFVKKMVAATDNATLGRVYIDHYRECTRYVIENQKSLTVIPVLFERLNAETPVFAMGTDAILFKNTADSLKTVYPNSRYVKALAAEAESRMKLLAINSQIESASQASFPELSIPDMTGERKSLSSIDAKAIIVHFWDCSDAEQKIINIDALLPIYKEYHDRGLEIYSVCINADKADWGSIVKSQNLPWINVNDGLGTASSAILTYNVSSLPSTFLIANGELHTEPINGSAGLRKELDKILRR